jgi:uncharacterized cupin superfamily protein
MPIRIKQPSDAEKAEARTWAIWECQPSVFEWGYAQEEECWVLEGKVKVEARGREFHFGAGDHVTFEKGLACRWHVIEAVKKHYRFNP